MHWQREVTRSTQGVSLATSRTRVIQGWGVAAVVLAVCLAHATVVRADFIGPIVTVEATTTHGLAEWVSKTVEFPDVVNDIVKYRLGENISLEVPGHGVVAEIESLDLTLNGDPAIDLAFAVSSGNFPTTFTITSALLNFPAISNPIALASAGVTVTDGDPLPGDGASVSLVAPRNGLYKAEYNGGTTFAELLASKSLLSSGTMSASASTGVQIIPASVDSIQTSFSFDLTADDSASGTSRFEVVIPEPVSAGMLVILGMAVAHARSSRRPTSA